VLRYTRFEPEERRNPQVATDYAKWFLGRLRAVEAATANAETLAAGRFTAADIVVGYALRLAENIGLAKDFGPNVAAYWQRLQQRGGYKNSPASGRRWLPASARELPRRFRLSGFDASHRPGMALWLTQARRPKRVA
jgi:glutathione S-transferase